MDKKTLVVADKAFRASIERITYAHKIARVCLIHAQQAQTPERFRAWIHRHSRVTLYIYTHTHKTI